MRHYAPPVVYQDSPLSYLAAGKAQKFYMGASLNSVGEKNTKINNPQNNVVHYCVIQPIYDINKNRNDIAIPPKQYQDQPEEN